MKLGVNNSKGALSTKITILLMAVIFIFSGCTVKSAINKFENYKASHDQKLIEANDKLDELGVIFEDEDLVLLQEKIDTLRPEIESALSDIKKAANAVRGLKNRLYLQQFGTMIVQAEEQYLAALDKYEEAIEAINNDEFILAGDLGDEAADIIAESRSMIGQAGEIQRNHAEEFVAE